MRGVEVTPQELEAFYERVDELCAEIFDASQDELDETVSVAREQAQS